MRRNDGRRKSERWTAFAAYPGSCGGGADRVRSVGEGMPRATETLSYKKNQMLCVPTTPWPVGTDR
jgi:hypothetical protein